MSMPDQPAGPLRFRPTFWASVFALAALVLLLALGTWQLQRLAWKEELITTFRARLTAPPMPPPERIEDIDRMRYRRVFADGTWLHEKELFLAGKTYEGTPGVHVVTPFRTAEGLTVLVNRGWIPESRRDPARRPGSQPEGTVRLEGLIQPDKRRATTWVPDNEPQKGLWLYVDTAPMAEKLGLGPVPAYYVDAVRTPGRNDLPIGADTRVDIRNEHLSYAITWYALACSLVVIYIVFHRRPEGAARKGEGRAP